VIHHFQARLNNVATAAVFDTASNRVVLAGGTTTISSWGQGNVYSGNTKTYRQSSLTPPSKPSVLLDGSGRVFGRMHPQYENYAVSDFVSVRSNGAKGDGVTDGKNLHYHFIFSRFADNHT
jgi:glucan 1,3-beta-glucosidase